MKTLAKLVFALTLIVSCMADAAYPNVLPVLVSQVPAVDPAASLPTSAIHVDADFTDLITLGMKMATSKNYAGVIVLLLLAAVKLVRNFGRKIPYVQKFEWLWTEQGKFALYVGGSVLGAVASSVVAGGFSIPTILQAVILGLAGYAVDQRAKAKVEEVKEKAVEKAKVVAAAATQDDLTKYLDKGV